MAWVYTSKHIFLIMKKSFFFFLIFISIIIAQVEYKHECSQARSTIRWLNAESTLTENQDKMDISYYGIELDIDFNAEMIYGSVKIEGQVGMNQPDSFEFDLFS